MFSHLEVLKSLQCYRVFLKICLYRTESQRRTRPEMSLTLYSIRMSHLEILITKMLLLEWLAKADGKSDIIKSSIFFQKHLNSSISSISIDQIVPISIKRLYMTWIQQIKATHTNVVVKKQLLFHKRRHIISQWNMSGYFSQCTNFNLYYTELCWSWILIPIMTERNLNMNYETKIFG